MKAIRAILKIGDKLYNRTFEYDVIGIRQYEKSNHYEVKCKSCRHGYDCQILLVPSDELDNAFLYAGILNEAEEDTQYYWHNQSPYFITRQAALIYESNQILKKRADSIEEMEKRFWKSKMRIEKAKNKK